MKFLYLLVFFFSCSVCADEFDWSHKGISISKAQVISNKTEIIVTLGSICGSDYRCETSAKYSTKDLKEVEFFRTVSDAKAELKIEKETILISLVYSPIGSSEVLNVTRYFEWNNTSQKLNENKL